MGEAASEVQPARITFGRYVLDSARGCLLLDEREITLRPKTFAVLQYLAQHPGKLVSKDELFETVWPGLIVTDDTLVQSIGELRRALGEEGGKLIVTVPRRGYRFDATAAPPERRKRGVRVALGANPRRALPLPSLDLGVDLEELHGLGSLLRELVHPDDDTRARLDLVLVSECRRLDPERAPTPCPVMGPPPTPSR